MLGTQAGTSKRKAYPQGSLLWSRGQEGCCGVSQTWPFPAGGAWWES